MKQGGIMSKLSSHAIIAMICLAVLVGVPSMATAGPVYQNQAKGYSVTLPDGWAPLTPEKLNEMAAAIAARGSSAKMTVDAGYAPKGLIGSNAEFLLIATLPNQGKQLPTRSMDAFMQGVIKGAKQSGGSNVTIESSSVDKAAKTYQLHMLFPGGGTDVHVVMAGFFGHRDIVQFMAYSSDSAFLSANAKYQEAAKSFRFDPAYAYDDREDGQDSAKLIGVVVGVVVGGIVAVVLAIRASRGKRTVVPIAGYGNYPQQPAPQQGWTKPNPPMPSAPPPPPPGGRWPNR